MIWRKIIGAIILLITPLITFANTSCAPPPKTFFIGGLIFILFITFNISIIISFIVNYLFGKFRKDKRKHFWYQSIIGFLISIGAIFGLVKFSLIDNNITICIIMIIAMIIGAIIGYFITPLKQIETTDNIKSSD